MLPLINFSVFFPNYIPNLRCIIFVNEGAVFAIAVGFLIVAAIEKTAASSNALVEFFAS